MTECFFFFLLATVIVAGVFISVKLNQTLGGKNNGRLQMDKKQHRKGSSAGHLKVDMIYKVFFDRAMK